MRFISPLTSVGLAEVNAMIGQLNYTLDGLSKSKGVEIVSALPDTAMQTKTVGIDYPPNQTVITFDNLDGISDGGYGFDISWTPGGTTACNLRIFVNNDMTIANYSSQRVQINNTTVAGLREAEPIISANSGSTGVVMVTGNIEITPSGEFIVSVISSLDVAASLLLRITVIKKTAVIDNITRIDFASELDGYIGKNSRFRIWPKNR